MDPDTEPLNWDYLKYFVALAEHGSLYGAARLLGTSHTTVGRNIALLEQRTGVRLFDRIENRYFLNSDGRRIFEAACQIRDRVLGVEELLDLGSPEQRDLVRIATTGFVSDHLFPEIVPHLLDHHYALSIDAVLGQDFSSGIDETYSLAICQYRNGRTGWNAHRLGELDIGFYCTRNYLNSASTTLNARHIRSHRFALWADARRAQRAPNTGIMKAASAAALLISDSLHIVLQTALQDRAVATIPRFIAVRHPELEAVLDDADLDMVPVWSHVNQKLVRSAEVRRLNDLISNAILRLPVGQAAP